MRSKVDIECSVEMSRLVLALSGHLSQWSKRWMRQTVHIFGWTDNTSILGTNVAVVNFRMGRNVAKMNREGRIVA